MSPQSDFTTKKKLIIATVNLVDPVRRVAKITTVDNKKMVVGFSESGGKYGEGDFSSPPSGRKWKCVVDLNMGGDPFISRFLPPGSMFADEDQIFGKPTKAKGAKDKRDSISKTSSPSFRSFSLDTSLNPKLNYRFNKFYDTIAGDIGNRGIEGNYTAVLRGGVNISYVSDLCQILQFLEDDLTRIVSRNFEIFTDLGVLQISNEEGLTKLSLKGNSGRNKEFSTREETYEFELQLGACEKIKDKAFILTFQYTTPNKDPLFFGIDVDGNVVSKIPRDHWEYSGEDRTIMAQSNIGLFSGKGIRVDAGSDLELVAGDIVEKDPNNPENFSKARSGKRILINKDKVREGNPEGDHKSYVQKPHLDEHFNKLCSLLFTVLNAPMADVNPSSLAIKTGLVSEIGKLLTDLPDTTNFTKDVEGT